MRWPTCPCQPMVTASQFHSRTSIVGAEMKGSTLSEQVIVTPPSRRLCQMLWERTNDLLVWMSWSLLFWVKFSHFQYHHSEGTWGTKSDKVLSTDLDSANLFLNNDSDPDNKQYRCISFWHIASIKTMILLFYAIISLYKGIIKVILIIFSIL